jgi:hypothetical protein
MIKYLMKQIIVPFLILFLLPSITTFAEDKNTDILPHTIDPIKFSQKNLSLELTSKKDTINSKHVKVFTVIDRIYDIEISKGTFTIEAEILLTWINKEDHFKLKSDFKDHTYSNQKMKDLLKEIWHPEFIVKSETVRRKTLFSTLHINPDGSLEIFEKFETTLPFNSQIRKYPFGELNLNLGIVAFTHDSEEMQFDPVSFEIGHQNQTEPVLIGSWTLVDSHFDKKLSDRLSTKSLMYSQNDFHFIIKHDFNDTLQRIFFPLGGVILISIFLTIISSLRFDQNIAVRVKGQLTLLLTVFALKFSLGDEIPHTHYLNLIDLIFLIAIGVIVVNLFSSMIISEMYLVGSYKKMNQIELFFDWLGPIILVIALAGSIYSVFYNST